jgi:hypothetical protein
MSDEIKAAVERLEVGIDDPHKMSDGRMVTEVFTDDLTTILSELTRLQAEVEGLRAKADKGKVYVTVTGLTGTGKSAVLGEIEIAMKAIGLEVETDQDLQTEKNMTGADWLDALELYKPVVVLREVNIP